MRSVNPATAELIREYDEMSPLDVERAVLAADENFESYRERPLSERTALLGRVAALLRQDQREYARLITEEMGKPITAAAKEIDKCAWVCELVAEHASRWLAPETVVTEAKKSYVRFDALGPILAIMPWNFPFWQLFRFGAAALAVGNVILLKHASNATGCALAIEQLFRRAGAPEALTALIIGEAPVERVIADPNVAGVTLTGSVRAGRVVGANAGHHLKKLVLELGGSDAFIVLSDAELGPAVDAAVTARMINSGQSCIAAKRFILEQPIAEAFSELFVDRMKKLRVGDPMDPDTDVGPLAREDLRQELHRQVNESLEDDAQLLLGGEPLDRPGWFYAPTVLSLVRPGVAAFEEETFGPVAALIVADDADHAVRLANQSRFGLGASLWTRNRARAEDLAARLECGSVFINAIVKSDPRLPFGGVKESGFGRELGVIGCREFSNVKTVWVE
jgi:succinate-semialdehyde dehydrogenase/glutarate-semialdehyde dehydrogenase